MAVEKFRDKKKKTKKKKEKKNTIIEEKARRHLDTSERVACTFGES